MESIFLWAMSTDYCLLLYSSKNKLTFMLGFSSLVDLLTMPLMLFLVDYLIFPCFASLSSSPEQWQDVRGISSDPTNFLVQFGWIRMTRLYGTRHIWREVFPQISDISVKLLSVLLGIIAILFSTAGAVFNEEACTEDDDFSNFFHFCWFAIVTISTVGYGDWSPGTYLGRIYVVFCITATLVLVPALLSEWGEALMMPKKVVGSLPHEKEEYVVLLGDPNPNQLKMFLAHFWQEGRNSRVKIVVLTAHNAQECFRELEFDTELDLDPDKLCFKQGDLLSSNWGVNLATAKAVFVLADVVAKDRQREDRRTVLRALAVMKVVSPRDCHVLLSTNNLENNFILAQKGLLNAVCVDELKMLMLVKSCTDCYGVISFISNLMAGGVVENAVHKKTVTWSAEYTSSLDQDILCLTAPRSLDGIPFHKIAKYFMSHFHALAVGVAFTRGFDGERKVLLFPRDWRCCSGDVIFMIANHPAIPIAMSHHTNLQELERANAGEVLLLFEESNGVDESTAGALVSSTSQEPPCTPLPLVENVEATRGVQKKVEVTREQGKKYKWGLGMEVKMFGNIHVICKIVQDSNVARSGLQVGDVLLAVEGHDLLEQRLDSLLACLAVSLTFTILPASYTISPVTVQPSLSAQAELELVSRAQTMRSSCTKSNEQCRVLMCGGGQRSLEAWLHLLSLFHLHTNVQLCLLLSDSSTLEEIKEAWLHQPTKDGDCSEFVVGNPLNQSDLLSAGLLRSQVVVISGHEEISYSGADTGDEFTLMVTALVKATLSKAESKCVEQGLTCPGTRVLVELADTNNVRWMDSGPTPGCGDRGSSHLYVPEYMDGNVVAESMLHPLVSCGYDKPGICSIVKGLLAVGDESQVVLSEVPPAVDKLPFELVFKHCVDVGMIPLGIQRQCSPATASTTQTSVAVAAGGGTSNMIKESRLEGSMVQSVPLANPYQATIVDSTTDKLYMLLCKQQGEHQEGGRPTSKN